MSYRVLILRRAQEELSKVPVDAYNRIRDSIQNLAGEPRPVGCLKLRGREGWRIRCGSYRVIYEIDDAKRVITVLHVGHRRDVYR